MNKKLLLLCLLSGMPVVATEDACQAQIAPLVQTVAQLGTQVTNLQSRNEMFEKAMESNSTLLKQVCYNVNKNYIKPAAYSAWNDYLVPGMYTAGSYAAMPLKYAGQVYIDNWMYTVPATVAALSIYAIYKCSDAIWYNLAQWCLKKSGRKPQPTGSSAIIKGNHNIVNQ